MVRSTDALDRDVRLFVYRCIIETGQAPGVDEVGRGLDADASDVAAAFRRLEANHVWVLAPGTTNLSMPAPFSTVPTPFWVETGKGSWWGGCVWEAFGIPPLVGADGSVFTFCPDCNEPMEFRIEGGNLQPSEGIVHFAVPALRWWENIVFT